MINIYGAFTSCEWEWGGMGTGWEWEWARMRMRNGLEWEWRMWMRFQCLLGKNKWEWECAGMPLMCLLGKINGNEEWKWESIYQNTYIINN